ncbi:helix-hairpin-helix domain-containing protein [Halorussus ruber]|uniref:helix-hairpin-helix domain-containing protein n=1 Tax=Halorussus ruber TaxID=1126238 RepID=UPI00143D58DB|nr:helix-hairpin-helix domain-containing protein [Halorussus ruber]
MPHKARESDSGSDPESLDGIGAKTAEKLSDAGIEDIEELYRENIYRLWVWRM